MTHVNAFKGEVEAAHAEASKALGTFKAKVDALVSKLEADTEPKTSADVPKDASSEDGNGKEPNKVAGPGVEGAAPHAKDSGQK